MSTETTLPLIDLFACKPVADAIGETHPVWVWSADGRQILWANIAGLKHLGFADLAEARARRLPNDSAASHLARIARSAPVIPAMARLRYFRGMKPVSVMATCRVLTLPEGSTILLGIGLEDRAGVAAGEGERIRTEVAALGDIAGPRVLVGPHGDIMVAGSDPEFRTCVNRALDEGAAALTRLSVVTMAGLRRRMRVLPIAGGYRLLVPGAVVQEEGLELLQHAATAHSAPAQRVVRDAAGALGAVEDIIPAGETPRAGTVQAARPEAAGANDAVIDTSPSPVLTDGTEAPSANEVAMTDTSDVASADTAAADGFAFRRRSRPSRFVWQMDADCRFTEVSGELAEAIGQKSEDLVGRTWAEVAGRLNLDPEGKVARALARCDTWSGLTVYWPVAGSRLVAPVDLAALPAFGHKRTFEGFRGFGVCRTMDAIENPRPRPVAMPTATTTAAQAETSPEPADDAAATVAAEAIPAPEALAAPRAPEARAAGAMASGSLVAAITPAATVLGAATVSRDMPAETLNDTALTAAAPDSGRDDGTAEPSDVSPTGSDEAAATATREAVSGEPVTADADDTLTAEEPENADAPEDDRVGDAQDEAPSEMDVPAMAETDADDDASMTGEPASETAANTTSSDDGPADDGTASGATGGEDAASPADETRQDAPSATDEDRDGAVSLSPEAARNEPAMAKIAEILHRTEEEAAARESDRATLERQAEHSAPDADIPASDSRSDEAETPATRQIARPFAPPSLAALPPTANGTVPDTRNLSRPEREAFRLIADLLGARLEGDDEDEEALAPPSGMESEESEEDKVVPLPSAFAAGKPKPIDPTLLDRLPIGVLIARDHDVLYLNQPMLDLTGYSSPATLAAAGGLSALFVDPDEAETADDGDDERPNGDRMLPIRRADGERIMVSARLHAVPWNDGNALMMSFQPAPPAPATSDAQIPAMAAAALSDDIAALSFRIEELETVIDTATDGVLMLDGDGLILGVNRSAEALFGIERSDMIGQTLASYLAPESRRLARDYLDGLAANGVASVLNDGREVIAEVAGGGLIPLFMTIGRVGEHSGNKFCAVLRDMTQLKRAEEDLTIAKREADGASSEKSELLGKISHEVRTPLNAIIGFSEIMMEERFGPVGNERYREYLRDIHSSGSLILNLVDDLLDLTRIEAGKMELTFEAVSANEIIQECVALTQPRANRERVIIRTSLSSAVPKIVADGRSLRQIVLNLLSNAINFNVSGGQVIVSTVLEDNGEVVIRVRDTGIGIREKDMDAVMEPFRQLHVTRKGSTGTGLGLPLTKALAEANRAAFSIDSEIGRGTLVQIAFPTTRVLAD